MYGKDIAALLNLTEKHDKKDQNSIKKELAKQLDINLKTLESWVSAPEKKLYSIGRPYVVYLRKIFEPLLLLEKIRELEEKIFKIAPSEFIGFWLVCGMELILLKDSVRNQLLKPQKKYKFYNDELHKRLSDNSMTIESIQTAQIINTSGDGINAHKKKIIPSTMANLLSGGKSISLLKIPLITGSSIGPRGIGLLDIRNKLEKREDGEYYQISIDENNRKKAFYTKDEVEQIRDIAQREYTTNMKEVLDALDYLDPQSSPGYLKTNS